MKSLKFSYTLDKNGPRGISIDSWLYRERSGLVLIDFQNFCTASRYGEVLKHAFPPRLGVHTTGVICALLLKMPASVISKMTTGVQ